MSALQIVYYFIFTTVASLLPQGQESKEYECYTWTSKDKSKFLINCTLYPTLRHSTCEDHPGYIYTHGNETLAPGCGTCKCCKPADTGSYQCHSWTYEDKAKFLLNCTYHNELERPTCESHPGFIYTQGNDTLAPGCTSCFCCKPTVSNNTVYPTTKATMSSSWVATTTLISTHITSSQEILSTRLTSPSITVVTKTTSFLASTGIVTKSTVSTTQVPIVIEESACFLDDPVNKAIVSTFAGLAVIGVMAVAGYVLMVYGKKVTSLCAT